MEELGVWDVLFPGIHVGMESRRTFRRLAAFLGRISRDFPDFKGRQWLAFFAALLMESPENLQLAAVDRLNLTETERHIVVKSLTELGAAEHALGGRAGPANSEIHLFLKDFPLVTCLFWSAATQRWRVRRRILLYLTRLHRIRPVLGGGDLLSMGYSANARIGLILEKLKKLSLDGMVATREDEEQYVRSHFPI